MWCGVVYHTRCQPYKCWTSKGMKKSYNEKCQVTPPTLLLRTKLFRHNFVLWTKSTCNNNEWDWKYSTTPRKEKLKFVKFCCGKKIKDENIYCHHFSAVRCITSLLLLKLCSILMCEILKNWNEKANKTFEEVNHKILPSSNEQQGKNGCFLFLHLVYFHHVCVRYI